MVFIINEKKNSDFHVCFESSKALVLSFTVSSQLVKPSCSAWSVILASDCANRRPVSSNDAGIWMFKKKLFVTSVPWVQMLSENHRELNG